MQELAARSAAVVSLMPRVAVVAIERYQRSIQRTGVAEPLEGCHRLSGVRRAERSDEASDVRAAITG